MTSRTAVVVMGLLLASSALCAEAQDTVPSSASKATKKSQLKAPTALVSQPANRITIEADGSIATKMPDGSLKLQRPGVCGSTMVFPDGRRSTVSCSQVQPATPPLPDQVSQRWLESHNEYLLAIIRSLLGGDQASVNNYLRNSEQPATTIYERIRLRTDLIAKLTESH